MVPDFTPGHPALRVLAALLGLMALTCTSLGGRLLVGAYLTLAHPSPEALDPGARAFFFALSGLSLLVFAVTLSWVCWKLWRKPAQSQIKSQRTTL